MDTHEQLARQLRSVRDLQSIVRTMKVLSAVSIRQHERAVQSVAEYNRTVDLGLRVVLRDVSWGPAAAVTSTDRGLVLFGSDHGLCGRFNEDLAGFAVARIGTQAGCRVRTIVVGSRAASLLEDRGVVIDRLLPLPGTAARATATVHALLQHIDDWRSSSLDLRVELIYNQRQGTGRARPTVLALLPVDLSRHRPGHDGRWPSRSLPTFTMPRNTLLAALLRQHLFVKLSLACAESQAAEHASRLSAMQSAERSLEERRMALIGEVRRERQQTITSELLDVVAGFEAMREGP